jgi:hypothetical protein
MKNLFLLVIALTFSIIVNGNPQKADVADNKPVKVTVADFNEKAAGLVGKKVVIVAIVDHICKHGGKKMILVAENTDARVKVTPQEGMGAFKPELEGEEVKVTGTVHEMKVDENYLNNWEDEIKAGFKKEKGIHEGKEEAMKNREGNSEKMAEDPMKQIKALRKKLKDSGKDHLSYYSIVCSDYEIVNTGDK